MRPRGRFCDFCHATNPPHWVACRSFTVDDVLPPSEVISKPPPMVMRDDWAACDRCYALVEAGDREGLLQRAMDSIWARWPEDDLRVRTIIRKQMRRTYEQFWEMRIEEKGIES